MPLHRNESAGQKTMTFAGEGVFVKENYHLSRERVSALTVLSSKNKKPKMELLFKGAGTRLMKTLNLPNNMSLQFAMKGSYREENQSSGQKTMTFGGEGVFVKENYHLSRERVSESTNQHVTAVCHEGQLQGGKSPIIH